ncbi:hypothetical protein MNBD_ALPHA09-64 [hydrothermal vent metagenome]|uniref:CblY, a non-orthologous displasment for Alpha-ribazole-5'-phosphate phosphatase n=1 Tax=hydrothermal vent metagenome TaxID=652676 RepID=A0A3B0T6E9_9ZZZZ
MTRNASAWIGLSILVATGAYLSAGPLIGLTPTTSPDELARLSSGIALLIVIGGSAALGYRGQATLALKQALVWIAIGLSLVVLYTYRADIGRLGARVLSQLAPGIVLEARALGQSGETGGIIAVTAGQGGQFDVEALVNGTSVRLLADTGATLVVLTHDDALRVGIDTGALRYNIPVQTANGVAKNALLHLEEISVGSITIPNIRALIAKPGQLETSLLGMSFLTRLTSFQISGDQLVLRE